MAEYGDSLDLAPGTYFEHDLILPLGVSIIGRTGSPESVVIDANQQGRVLIGENVDDRNRIQGVTIRGGFGAGGFGIGAKFIGSIVLSNLVVEDNGSDWGYGIGLYCLQPLLIEDCVFRNNRSPHPDSHGGGLYLGPHAMGTTVVRRCDFIGNQAGHGAALYSGAGDVVLFDSLRLLNNEGTITLALYGGALGGYPLFRVENSVIAHNEGVGIYAISSGWIRNCTILDCKSGVWVSGDLWNGSLVYIDNSLIAGNASDEPGGGGVRSFSSPYTGYIFLTCSNVYGNTPANYAGMVDPTGNDGNISLDPRFCPGAGPEDYPLRKDSPCAPENNDCGLLIGAFPTGCEDTTVAPSSWSHIKSLY